ncbi:MAG: efflux RND transporter permease subunit [Nitrospiraceae bacterium]
MINREPGANIIATVDRLKALLPQLSASIPGSMNLSVVVDRTPVIRASLHDVERTLAISVGLVILVVFLFLRDIRATLIPSVAVPVSLISTFGVMYLLDYSLDNLSLMALTIATGFVVDDAIVVLENISRYEEGMPPLQAALRGAREINFTVLSMTISLVAVFLPILFMGGMMGRLFREFAVTLSVAILISLVISLTTTPMMCARVLATREGTVARPFVPDERRHLRRHAGRLCAQSRWVLRHPRSMLTLTLATMAVSVYLYTIVPKGFFPQQDTGRMFGNIQAAQDIQVPGHAAKLLEVVDIIRSDPAVDTVTGFSGGRAAIPTQAACSFGCAARRAADERDQVTRGCGPNWRRCQRPHGPAGHSRFAHRRPRQQRAVPIHVAERRLGGVEHLGGQGRAKAADGA